MKTSRMRRPRSCRFENLERREVLTAGITASLDASGVLNVVGTDGDDQLYFQRDNKTISIHDVDGSWSAKSVKKIVIDVGAGHDFVSLDSRANGGNKKLTEKTWVKSGDSDELVRMAKGSTAHFGDADSEIEPVIRRRTNKRPSAATVSVSLRKGTLKVNCTDGADNINLRQISGKISIDGISGSWAATKVKSILINLQGGDDYVSLDSLANGGNQALQESITIKSGAGNETVHLANGHDVTFSGSGHTLKVAPDGTATLDGNVLSWDDPAPTPDPDPTPDPTPDPDPTPVPDPTPANWFDANIQDAALRSLGASLYVDGVINRSDIMALFESAKDGGTVDSTEFNDFKAIVSNSTLFGTFDYVWKLSTYIVNGNAANAKYQGSTLGNLKAGSTDAQLGNLVNKWFLGLDRPTAGGTYRQIAGTLFVSGAAYTDIEQGNVGDCYLMAALAEFAQHDATGVANMFIVNGDGTYTVRFFNSGTAEYVTVDSYLPTNSLGRLIYASHGALYNDANNELWVALAEKAYAQLNEMGWVRPGLDGNGVNSYAAIVGGYISAALRQVTGQATATTTMSSSTSFTTFVNAYNAGEMIGFATKVSPASSSIPGSHAFTVVSYNSTNKTVTLFNVWGTDYGLVTMNWSDIQANFSYFDCTV